jgi:hypothetical protein
MPSRTLSISPVILKNLEEPVGPLLNTTFYMPSRTLSISPVILKNLEEPVGPLLNSDTDFFGYLADAMALPPLMESYVDTFAALILKLIHYDEGCCLIQFQSMWMQKQVFVLESTPVVVRVQSICSLCKKIKSINFIFLC